MMSGKQLAGWLRVIANQVESAGDNVDGKSFSEGPVTVQVAPASTLRSWKHRHGSVAPPDVEDPSFDVIRATIRDAFATHGATLLQCIQDANATLVENAAARGASAALDAFSLRDLKNTTTSDPDRSSRAQEAAVVVVGGATDLQRGQAFIPCPPNLRLLDEQVANLEMGKSIPERFVRNVTAGFVAKYLGDPDDKRTLANWRKGLGTTVIRIWDSKQRQEYLYDEPDEKAQADRAERHRRLLEATDRKAAAEDEARRRRLLGPAKADGSVPKDQAGAILQLVSGIGGSHKGRNA